MRSEARRALNELYATTSAARRVGESARAVLVFPSMVKAGFIVGGQHGDGRWDFRQNGLMAGIGLQGTKVTQIHPD